MVAEKMLSERPDSVERHAHPHIVADILRNGSWEKDDATQRMWAGLLVSSCDEHGTDESNRDLVDLLVEVTTSQVHILIDGCRRSAERWLSTDGSASLPIILDQQEMIRVTGMYDVYRNATDVAYLHNLGLIERNFDFSTHSSSTDFDVTPTVLGMRLYRTCLGNLIEDAVSSS